jgi:hypothetical protein
MFPKDSLNDRYCFLTWLSLIILRYFSRGMILTVAERAGRLDLDGDHLVCVVSERALADYLGMLREKESPLWMRYKVIRS